LPSDVIRGRTLVSLLREAVTLVAVWLDASAGEGRSEKDMRQR
jgi:hypothetical protein